MTLIKNCKLYTMADLNDVMGSIVIEDGKISQIGEVDLNANYDEVIDAKGQFVMPGIVDPHCHIGVDYAIYGKSTNDTNEMIDPVTPQVRGFDGVKNCDEYFQEALEAGVTTVCTGPGSANVIGGTFCALKTVGETVEDKLMIEEIAMKMALGENPKRCYDGKSISTRMGSAAIMREALTQAKLYKESWDSYSNKVKEDPNAIKPAYNAKWHSLKRVFEGMPVKIHCHQEDDILTACRISEEFGLDSTIDHCTSGWIIPEKLKKYGKTAILGPVFGSKMKVELKDKSFESARVLYENNIPFCFMTDHPVVPLTYTRTQAALFVKEGLPYLEGLKALSIYAAKAVHLDNLVGSLEIGKEADIVIYDGDPFHYMTSVKQVLIRGKVVFSK